MSQLNPFYFCDMLTHLTDTSDTTLHPSETEAHEQLIRALSNLTASVDCGIRRKHLETVRKQEDILIVTGLVLALVFLLAALTFIVLLYKQGERAAWTVNAHDIPVISDPKMDICLLYVCKYILLTV